MVVLVRGLEGMQIDVPLLLNCGTGTQQACKEAYPRLPCSSIWTWKNEYKEVNLGCLTVVVVVWAPTGSYI